VLQQVEIKDAMREDSASESYLLDAPEGSPDSGDATAGTGHHGMGVVSVSAKTMHNWLLWLHLLSHTLHICSLTTVPADTSSS
jgi:hypothetical protein